MNIENSFSRIVSYFHALSNESFTYNNIIIEPYEKLIITENVFRSFTCPENCGACCVKCSLIWPESNELQNLELSPQTINGITVNFFEDKQKYNKINRCAYLNIINGRCNIYHIRPLPCRFELFKFAHYTSKNKVYAHVALPGRGWAYTRITGVKGNLCKIVPYDKNLTLSHINDLQILQKWMEQFNIKNDVDKIINYLNIGPIQTPLVIERNLTVKSFEL